MIKYNTKYYKAKIGGTKEFWGYNPHYRWNKLAHDVVIQLPRNMVTEVSKNENS